MVVEKEVPKELKIEFVKKLLSIFISLNFILYLLLFAFVFSSLYLDLFVALKKTLDSLIIIFGIEGGVLIFLGLITKEGDYSFMIQRKPREYYYLQKPPEEDNIMSLLDKPEIFNKMVRFTKKVFIYGGLSLVVLSIVYYFFF
ncbi:MAG: hypothetical protein J7L07_08430 [Candidatus Odinarchaeota archaeon]|nr:hypothetical protein [Candidatus Odinarchaeota archaeon]